MVDNHYGHYLWDVLVSLLGCYSFMGASYYVKALFPRLSNVCMWMGKNSLTILCVHLVELNCIPWHKILNVPYAGIWIGVIYICKIIFILFVTYGLGEVRLHSWIRLPFDKHKAEGTLKNRIAWIDISKGIAILLMIIGHMTIPQLFRIVIFSFHMPLFFITSAYFMRRKRIIAEIKSSVSHLVKPYSMACILTFAVAIWNYIFYIHKDGMQIIHILMLAKRYLFGWLYGMSFSSTILTDVMSVGSVWFIICLFLARVVFAAVLQVSDNKYVQVAIVFALHIAGYIIGKKIAFLPYSFDVSLFALPYLCVGYFLGIGSKSWTPDMRDMKIFIPALVVWCIGIYYGGIELAIRAYPSYPICLAASIAGSILVFMIAHGMEHFSLAADILCFFGKHSLFILIVHLIELRFVHWLTVLPGIHWTELMMLKIILFTACIILFIFLQYCWQNISKMARGSSFSKQEISTYF